VWDLATGKETLNLDVPITSHIQLLWLPDGKTLVTAEGDWKIRLWDTATGKLLGRLAILDTKARRRGDMIRSAGNPNLGIVPAGYVRAYEALACSADGRMLFAASEGELQIDVWDLAARRLVRTLTGHFKPARHLALSPDGKTLAAGCGDSSIYLWDLATGQLREPNAAPRGRYWVARFAPDGKLLATAGEDAVIHLWETTRWTEIRSLAGSEPREDVRDLSFSADGKTLASIERGLFSTEPFTIVRLWDLATGRETRLRIDPRPQESRRSVALSPDGKLVAACGSVWDVATGKERARFPFRWANNLAFTLEGRILATASENNEYIISVWEPLTGKVLRPPMPHLRRGSEIAFSPDGKRLASAGQDGTASLWDLATGKELRRFAEGGDNIAAIALSPDGKTLITVRQFSRGDWDRSLTLWEVASGKERARWPGHRFQVLSFSFSPDGRWLASASDDSSALIWDVTGRQGKEGSLSVPLRSGQAETLWADLGDADAGKAYQTIGTLIANPRAAVALLSERLHLAPAPDLAQISRLLTDLDSAQFAVRESAERALAKLDRKAETALRTALEGKPALELRRRVEGLLAKLDEPISDPERLREIRAVEVLEYIGTPEARQLLAALARGTPHARLTQEAKASVERLARRPRQE
jgi:WD40 repeat protein